MGQKITIGTTIPGRASLRQIETLEAMLDEHQLHAGHYSRLRKLLLMHRLDVVSPGQGSRMTAETASRTIRWLGRQIDNGTTKRWETP
jgi:hypothetical protein